MRLRLPEAPTARLAPEEVAEPQRQRCLEVEMPAIAFHRGAWLMDTQHGRVGQYMDCVGGRVHLRPVGGGKEWAVSLGNLRRATAEELKRAGVLRMGGRKR